MIVSLVLFGYAVLLATAGMRLLRRATFVEAAPRLGVLAWQALTMSVVVSTVLGGLALTVPTVHVSADLAGLLTACAMALRAQYAAPGGAAVGTTGAVLALGVLVRCGYCLTRTLASASGTRTRQHETLALLGRTDQRLGVTVVDHELPAAYCLPGRGRRIVLTSGALGSLGDVELASVLAHERAHLRERHDLVLAGAEALERAFPRLSAFSVARVEIGRLLEMAADDAASARTDCLTVAGALLTLAGQPVPAAAFGAAGSTAAARIRRLIDGVAPLSRPRAAAASLGAALMLGVPVISLSAPAIVSMGLDYCATQSTGQSPSQVTVSAPIS